MIEIDLNNKLQTKIYRKSIHTGQYIHYSSKEPEFVERATIKTLVSRAKTVCITKAVSTSEPNDINKTIQLNGYPACLIIRKSIKQHRYLTIKLQKNEKFEIVFNYLRPPNCFFI